MVNQLKLYKEKIALITIVLVIIKLGFEYRLELLKSKNEIKPKSAISQEHVIRCVNMYNDCIRKTQGEPNGDYFSYSCEQIKDMCDKACIK